jgi:hypothetical protein
MKRFGAIFAAAAALAALAWSVATTTNVKHDERSLHQQLASVKATADYAASLAEIGDRVIDLPDDGHAWYTTVLTGEKLSAGDQQLLAWFDREPELVRLKQQTHFNHYTPRSAVYKNVARAASNGLPAVVLQDSTGAVVYKASGDNVPKQPWPLIRGIIDCIRAHCPHCPRPKPKPTPEPAPLEPPNDKPIIPDVVGPNDDTPSDGRDDTIPVTAAVFVIVFIGSFIATAKGSTSHTVPLK